MGTKSNEQTIDQECAAPRRSFVAAAVSLGAGVLSGCGTSSRKEAPPPERSASTAIRWKVQSHVGGDTATFRAFNSFCESVATLSHAQLVPQPFPPSRVSASTH